MSGFCGGAVVGSDGFGGGWGTFLRCMLRVLDEVDIDPSKQIIILVKNPPQQNDLNEIYLQIH